MATTTFSLKELEDDPRLFLYTSLTAGSSHIITATSRMETILKANRIPFQAIDMATDEKARRLWQRRAGQRKLPGLVKQGFVVGDLNEVEEWNEFGELREAIGPVPANNAAPAGGQVGVKIAPPSLPIIPTATQGTATIRQAAVDPASQQTGFDKSKAIRLPGAGEIAARHKEKAAAAAAAASVATAKPSTRLEAINPETMTSSPNERKESIEIAKEAAATTQQKTGPRVSIASSPPPAKVENQKEEKKKAEEATKAEDAPEEESSTADSKAAPTSEKETESDKAAAVIDTSDGAETATEMEAVTKEVAALKVSEEKTQEQSATEPENAAKSVED